MKTKAYFVATILHVGIGMLVYGLSQLAGDPHVPQDAVRLLALGTLATYGSVVIAVAFVYVPLAPWIRRASAVANWRRILWKELPTILALVPIVMGLYKILKKAWTEIKTGHTNGHLDLEKVSAVVTQVAADTESLLKERPVNQKAA